MTDVNKVGSDSIESNLPQSAPQNPTQAVQPPVEKTTPVNQSQGIDEQLKKLNDKLEDLTRKYKGSTEEALRLKEENDKLKSNLQESSTTVSSSDKDFQKILETAGLEAAVSHLVSSKIAPVVKKVETIYEDKSQKIVDDFIASHKGLANPQVLEKFNAEFQLLKMTYKNPLEALEKAYILAGGRDAEGQPSSQSVEASKEAQTKVEEKLIKTVSTGNADQSQQPPLSQKDELQKKLSDLRFQAMSLGARGRDATDVWIQIDSLEKQLRNQK